ncbi:MAG: hypothetical protein IJ064_05610 [Bacteroidaceae bacterium]|nr:hypothetical protein [Bacteroidaceae bacterium]
MKLSEVTPAIEEKYQDLFQNTINAIDTYKADGDIKAFKATLFNIIDQKPSMAYLDPDVLSCYDIEADDSEWVEFTDEENAWDKKMLKECIDKYKEFEPCQLSTGSSASILITLFGDAY